MGQFSGDMQPFGRPLSFIHPKDNDFEKGRFSKRVLRIPGLSEEERIELQERIDDLIRIRQGERDLF